MEAQNQEMNNCARPPADVCPKSGPGAGRKDAEV